VGEERREKRGGGEPGGKVIVGRRRGRLNRPPPLSESWEHFIALAWGCWSPILAMVDPCAGCVGARCMAGVRYGSAETRAKTLLFLNAGCTRVPSGLKRPC